MADEETSLSVVGYLRQMDVAARDLPQSVRVDLRSRTVDELVARLGPAPEQTEVAAALGELGGPAERVAAERDRLGLEVDPLIARDVAAVYLLASGPFLFGLGVLAGLMLLWTSSRWPAKQRWIATALLVVGAAVPIVVSLAVPAFDLRLALLVGVLVVGPWSATAYLATLRTRRRMRAARQAERQAPAN